jgi:hypothetical protein
MVDFESIKFITFKVYHMIICFLNIDVNYKGNYIIIIS